MKLQGNTILITGGGSGIGMGLAEAFHKLGNQVIICGRREDAISKVCARNPGMRHIPMDVTALDSIRGATSRVLAEWPALNCVINNAGVQRYVDFSANRPIDDSGLKPKSVRISSVWFVSVRSLPGIFAAKSPPL